MITWNTLAELDERRRDEAMRKWELLWPRLQDLGTPRQNARGPYQVDEGQPTLHGVFVVVENFAEKREEWLARDEDPCRILNVSVVWAAGASERKVPASP
jgi:hypothetical protein